MARACDDEDPALACEYDAFDCPITTTRPQLFWPSKCISFGVQQDGSAKLGIDYDETSASAERAITRWLEADCGSGNPGVSLLDMGPIECSRVEYNQTGNANVFLFSDSSWPFGQASRTIALTIIQFNTETGEIFDADIAFNSAYMRLRPAGSDIEGFNLDDVMTHEIGHFLGLAHSDAPRAIMSAQYADRDEEVSLDPDDREGVCAVHPPDASSAQEDCRPRHGFHSACGGRTPTVSGGCSFSSHGGPANGVAALFIVLLAGLGHAQRRRRSGRA